ncbi:MAG: NosD domain-containing protein, partial [Methanoregula sp.]|nr:NosD domain-containing protein [Methanoregula sp.]
MNLLKLRGGILIILGVLALLVLPAAAATTQIHIVKYAQDNTTILAEQTVNYSWMSANLPVLGDGTTHYYHQGPVFVDDATNETHEQELRWNPAEDTNVDTKDMGAVKGTNLKDLCDLVGGMSDGEEVKVLSVDGWSDRYAYKNVYQYSSREGPLGICWYQDGKYPDTGYSDGMRLVWFADTSVNPGGLHAFGNYDWHEAAAPEYWYYYNSGSEYYPTTTGLSGKYVNRIFIYSNDAPPVAPVAAFTAVPVTGAAPLTVRFTDQSAGTPTSWAWDVNNDGTTDTTTQNATYTYTTAGNYTVNLTVRNTAGSDTEVKTDYITVTAAGARTWYVDDSGGADFTTIQAAVNAASPGDIIKVGDGTYRENIQIDRKVTLEAANRGMARIIPVNANVPVIKVVADRVTIRGMEIRGTEFSRYRCIWGISLNSAANCTIEECEIWNSNWGIYLTDARDCTVRDTIITDGYRAIQVCGGSHDNLIEGNFLSWNADYAIWAEGTNSNRFVRNRMHGAEGGGAIDLRNACNNTITENVIDCYIPQGYQGICVESGSTNNTIYLNDFLGNKYLASDLGGPNAWNATTLVNYTWNNQTRTGYPGNYWQQVTNGYGYTGSDSDGDGLGDTPYTLHNSDESDLHPLIRPVAGYLPGEETEPTWIIITPELPTIVTGETRPFSARYSDRHGVRLYDLPVNWSCNNLTVGTVDNNGLFTAARPGTALVTAAAGTVAASTRVTVVQRTPQEGNATIIVDRAGRGNYTTISAAVAAARAGDRIIVHPGTYTEAVQITSPVSIVGESGAGSTAIQATDTSGPCLTVLCNGVEVTGFSLSGAKYAPAVLVKGTSGCRIAGVMVEGCNEAIRLDGSWNTSIVNLSITGCDKGIVLVNGSNGNRIEGCAVSWTEDYSIWIEEGTNNRVAGNVLSDSKGGGAIALVRSDANTVTGNDFICPYEGYHGVFLWQSAKNRISVNNFRQSIIPVFSAESTNFWDTKTPVPYYFDGVKNTSRLGNYWEIVPPTGYTGSDKDGDGIGDTVYNVPYSNDVDTHPLMEKIDQYTLGILPVAAFTTDVQTGAAPLTVRFTDTSTGSPTAWAWDVNNDGTIDTTTQNAAYTYATAGNYTVNLTVTNADGSDTEVKTGYIIVLAGVPPVRNADTGVRYATIQEAVTAASAGNTIVVSNGSYTENVAINVSITIRSEHGNLTTTVTAASPTLPVFDVNANGVVVRGFTVRGPTNEHVAGIEIVGFNDCLVTGNDCSLCYNGIHIGETGMNNTVTENYCHANTRRGISLRDSAHDNLIILNTVEDNADAGICIKDTPYDNIVWLNNIIGNRVEILTANTAHSPDTVTYVYNSNRYTHYLGNYYYDYTGTDPDGNGVGNTAYTSGSFYTDSYPLMAKNTNYGELTPPAPVANFTSDVQAGPAPLTVNFTDQSTSSPTTWAWDVNNDGLVDSTVQNPRHTYTTAGTYTVNLTVANAGGSDSEVKTDYITVSVPAPALLWGPYLTGTTTTGTVVNAKTSVATNLTVEYATGAFYTAHAAYDKNTTDGVSTQLHHIALPGLSPGTRYHYRVVYDGIATHDLTFSTFPEHGTFTFVMYSDTQDQLPTFSQLERHKLVADRIAQE